MAARFEAVSAKSDGGNFGGGQREVVEAQQVLVEVLKRTVAELRQECWLRAGGVEVRKWEGGDKMMQRIAKSRLRWAAGAEQEGMSQQESEAEGEWHRTPVRVSTYFTYSGVEAPYIVNTRFFGLGRKP